jgi:hypothetical protein
VRHPLGQQGQPVGQRVRVDVLGHWASVVEGKASGAA